MLKGKTGPEKSHKILDHELVEVPSKLVVATQKSCEMPVPHWHAQVEINFVYSGGLTYRMADHTVHLTAGDLSIFWGGQPHQAIQVDPDTEFVAMHLPLVHFFRLRFSPKLTQQLTRGATLLVETDGAADKDSFRRMTSYMLSGDAERTEYAVEELLTRLNRIRFEPYRLIGEASETADIASPPDNATYRNIIEICTFVSENFRENIGSADVASFVEIHPKYAMSVFKKSTGMTLNEYITLLRLSYAQSLLMDDELTILTIAMESGFGSLSAFSQAFRRVTGCSASDFRRHGRVN